MQNSVNANNQRTEGPLNQYGLARQAAMLLGIASKCHALAAELALNMEMEKARYWQEKAEHAEALAAKLTKEEAPNAAGEPHPPANQTYDEQWMHEPDDGRGWKCHVCKYGGSSNNSANSFCANCHTHR